MDHRNRRRRASTCTLCEYPTVMPLVVCAFRISDGSYKTRYRLCWGCGYKLLAQLSDWRKVMAS